MDGLRLVAGRGERVEVAGLDLGGARAETAIGGQELGGDLEGVGHGEEPHVEAEGWS